MSSLKNKVAVITGGTSGIGLATAKEFIKEGANVVITGRSEQSVNNALLELNNNARGVTLDVSDLNDIQLLKGKLGKHFPSIDIVFVNAGIALSALAAEVDEAHFDRLFDTNVKGAFFTIQQLLPLMNDGGSIVLNSSATVHRGFAGFSVYSATKATLVSFAKTLSAELLGRKIRVNVVSPGPIATTLYDKMGFPLEQAIAAYEETVPMKRFGEAAEIASIVKFLASSESSFVIGEEIIAGGGVGTM